MSDMHSHGKLSDHTSITYPTSFNQYYQCSFIASREKKNQHQIESLSQARKNTVSTVYFCDLQE